MRAHPSSRPEGRCLEHRTRFDVPFRVVDSLSVAWHGHYLAWFEDGREDFGRTWGLAYLDLLGQGLLAPVVHASVDYLRPALYGDTLEVVTRLFPRPAARLEFAYEIRRLGRRSGAPEAYRRVGSARFLGPDDREGADAALLATGVTWQALLDAEGQLVLYRPTFLDAFFERWSDRMTTAPTKVPT